jgi:hypothetical protein
MEVKNGYLYIGSYTIRGLRRVPMLNRDATTQQSRYGFSAIYEREVGSGGTGGN